MNVPIDKKSVFNYLNGPGKGVMSYLVFASG